MSTLLDLLHWFVAGIGLTCGYVLVNAIVNLIARR